MLFSYLYEVPSKPYIVDRVSSSAGCQERQHSAGGRIEVTTPAIIVGPPSTLGSIQVRQQLSLISFEPYSSRNIHIREGRKIWYKKGLTRKHICADSSYLNGRRSYSGPCSSSVRLIIKTLRPDREAKL